VKVTPASRYTPVVVAAISGRRCSTGQEPYSIALTILALPEAPQLDVKIWRPILIPTSSRRAGQALNSEDLVEPIWRCAISSFRATLRTKNFGLLGPAPLAVTFNELNLMGHWPMKGKFQAIFCRNVVIYFDEQTQERMWARFASCLAPDGRRRLGIPSGWPTRHRSLINDGLTSYHLPVVVITAARVLVVDDLPTMRGLISATLRADPDRGGCW
jgi:chemotaxis protein methyltransferase CheR